MSHETSSHVIAGGVRDKERVVQLLRRGTNTLDVEWSATATGPIKDVRKERFLGLAKGINIRLIGSQVEVGLEGERPMVLSGPGVEACYQVIPKGFRFSSFAAARNGETQQEVDSRAHVTMSALNTLAADLSRDPGAYSIRFGYTEAVVHL